MLHVVVFSLSSGDGAYDTNAELMTMAAVNACHISVSIHIEQFISPVCLRFLA
jgi:hypothetical protein